MLHSVFNIFSDPIEDHTILTWSQCFCATWTGQLQKLDVIEWYGQVTSKCLLHHAHISHFVSRLRQLTIYYLLFTPFRLRFTAPVVNAANMVRFKQSTLYSYGIFFFEKHFHVAYMECMMYKLLMCWPINSSHSKQCIVRKVVDQSFHIQPQRGAWPGLWVHFCVFYTNCMHDWRANSKNFNHSNQPFCSVIFFANSHKMKRWAVSF